VICYLLETRVGFEYLSTRNREKCEMKHVRGVSKSPSRGQISNFQVLMDFLVKLTDQIIEFIFIKTS